MSAPNLDPATLRWVAKELEEDVPRVRGMLTADDHVLLRVKLIGHARRLRLRAERLERKRGKP